MNYNRFFTKIDFDKDVQQVMNVYHATYGAMPKSIKVINSYRNMIGMQVGNAKIVKEDVHAAITMTYKKLGGK
jgi:hypothetical protein